MPYEFSNSLFLSVASTPSTPSPAKVAKEKGPSPWGRGRKGAGRGKPGSVGWERRGWSGEVLEDIVFVECLGQGTTWLPESRCSLEDTNGSLLNYSGHPYICKYEYEYKSEYEI